MTSDQGAPGKHELQAQQGQAVTVQRRVIRAVAIRQGQKVAAARTVQLAGAALGFSGDLKVRVFSAPQTTTVPSAVAVIPVAVPITSAEVREALADVIRESIEVALEPAVQAAMEKAGGRRSLGEQLTIVAFPFVPAGFVAVLLFAFLDPATAAVWSVATLLATVILMVHPDGDELWRRLSEWLGSGEDQ